MVSSALLAHPCSFVPSTFAPFAKLALGPLHCLCPGLRLGIVWGQGGLRCMPAHGPAAACQGDLWPVWAGPQDPAHLDVKRQMHRQRAATGPVQAQRLGHSQLHTRQRCWRGLQLQWASVSQESRGRVAAEAQDTVQSSVQFLFSPPSFHSTGAWSLSHEPAGYPALHVCTSHFCMHVSSVAHVCPRERAGAPPSAALHAEGCRPFMICTLMHCEAAAAKMAPPVRLPHQVCKGSTAYQGCRAAQKGTSAAAQRQRRRRRDWRRMRLGTIAPLPPAVAVDCTCQCPCCKPSLGRRRVQPDGARQLQRAQCLRRRTCAVQRL